MGIKFKDWIRTEGKKVGERWFIFLLMLLVMLAVCILAIPFAILFVIGSIVYMLGAGLAAILNEIFYRKPVDETFEELTDKYADLVFNFIND